MWIYKVCKQNFSWHHVFIQNWRGTCRRRGWPPCGGEPHPPWLGDWQLWWCSSTWWFLKSLSRSLLKTYFGACSFLVPLCWKWVLGCYGRHYSLFYIEIFIIYIFSAFGYSKTMKFYTSLTKNFIGTYFLEIFLFNIYGIHNVSQILSSHSSGRWWWTQPSWPHTARPSRPSSALATSRYLKLTIFYEAQVRHF